MNSLISLRGSAMPRLVQVRECDGKCCEESPRWPNADGLSCVYLKDGKCQIKSGDEELTTEPSPTNPDKSAEETFKKTCLDWPQNSPVDRGTGGCCWQWVDG